MNLHTLPFDEASYQLYRIQKTILDSMPPASGYVPFILDPTGRPNREPVA